MSDERVFDENDLETLRLAVRDMHAHYGKGQLLRAVCVCGHPTGPGVEACAAYRRLLRAVTDDEAPTPADPQQGGAK